MEFEDELNFEFDIFDDLALSSDEQPSSKIAAQAYELELQKQQECLFAVWNGVTAVPLQCLLGNIVLELQPNEADYLMRLSVVGQLSTVLNSLETVKGAMITPFGSFESNLYTRWADLDLSLELPESSDLSGPIGRSQKVKVLKSLRRVLIKRGEAHKVQFIPHARVPLLTFEDSHYNISCDISVDNGVAVLKSRLLRWISDMDPRCRELIFLVKCWAKAHCINDPKTGTLNSFALCLLVVFHLQTRSPPVLPPLNAVVHEDIASKLSGRHPQHFREQLLEECREKIQGFTNRRFGAENRSSVAELFVSFFYQFSSVAGLWLQGLAVCTFTGKWGDRTTTSKQWRSKQYVMTVEDPFDRSENCARSVQENTFSGISHAFSSTAEVLHHPPAYYALSGLREGLFCWPSGTPRPGVKFWLTGEFSSKGRIGQVKAFKRSPGQDNMQSKIMPGGSYRPGQTVEARPYHNGTVRNKGSKVFSGTLEHNRSGFVSREVGSSIGYSNANIGSGLDLHNDGQPALSTIKPHQCFTTVGDVANRRRRKNKGWSVIDRGYKPISSERVVSDVSHEELEGYMPKIHGHTVGETEQRFHQDEAEMGSKNEDDAKFCNLKAISAQQEPATCFYKSSEMNKTGPEMAVECTHSQRDDEKTLTTKNSTFRKNRNRRGRRLNRERASLESENIAVSLSEVNITDQRMLEMPSQRIDIMSNHLECTVFVAQGSAALALGRERFEPPSHLKCMKEKATLREAKEDSGRREDIGPRECEKLKQGSSKDKNWKPGKEEYGRFPFVKESGQEGKDLQSASESTLKASQSTLVVEKMTGQSYLTAIADGLESKGESNLRTTESGKQLRFHDRRNNRKIGPQLWRPKFSDTECLNKES